MRVARVGRPAHAEDMTRPASFTVRLGRLGLVTACACSVMISCGGGGGGVRLPSSTPPAAADDGPRSQLEGEWTLVALETGGARRQVSGFLRYDRFANIVVKAELAPGDPAARPPRTVVADFTAKADAGAGELNYTGLQQGAGSERLTEDAVTMGEWRYFEVSGDTLRLSVRDRAGRPAATLVFQRAR
jgi:hypothetical protein